MGGAYLGNLRARHGETPQKGLPGGPSGGPYGPILGPLLEAKSPETQLKPSQKGLKTGAQALRPRIWGSEGLGQGSEGPSLPRDVVNSQGFPGIWGPREQGH